MRALIILVCFLAACTVPQMAGNKTETIELPVTPEPPAVEVTTPKKETRTRKMITKPSEKPPEPDLINPVAECSNVNLSDPKEATRAKLDCMNDRLDTQ